MRPLIIFLIIIILFIMTISIMTIVLIKNTNDRIKAEVKAEEDRKIATQLYSENKMWVEFYGDQWVFTGPFTKLYTEECSKYTHGFCAEETYEIRILPPGSYPYQIKGDDLYRQFDRYSVVFMTPDFMSESGEHYFIQ